MKNLWNVVFAITILSCICAACEDENEPMVDLPAAIRDYLAQNYGDYKIEESELDTLCTGVAVYEVELERKGLRLREDEVELTFAAEGGLLFTEKEIKTSDLPSEVRSAISTRFAGFSIEEAERLDLANGTKQYEVEIKNGNTVREVLLAANGTVICEQAGDDDED